MGSVISYIKCPRCSNDNLNVESFYKIGEEYSFCTDCGYTRSVVAERNDLGEYVTRLSSRPPGPGNFIFKVTELLNPYGAYEIQYLKGIGQMGALLSEDDYKALGIKIEQMVDWENSIKYAHVKRYDEVDKCIHTDILFDTSS